MKEQEREKPRPAAVEPRLELGLDPQARPGSRCPHCLEDVGEEAYRCNRCRARFHLGCLGESATRGCSLCGAGVLPERRTAQARHDLDYASGRAHMWGAVAGILAWLPYLVLCGVLFRVLDLPDRWLGGVMVAPMVLSWLTSRWTAAFLRARATRRP
ncbi:MAG: hypothetical protein R3F62_11720 [Planctomycetota bacterium]